MLGVLALVCTAPAMAATGSAQGNLTPINDKDAAGRAMVDVKGTTITVDLTSTGLLPDQPHAAHIHFGADARHECPTLSEDADGSGTLTTSEGAAAYGPIVVSLTKTGDTSPDSGLAVDRFDTAPGGKIQYERGSIEVDEAVAQAIVDGQSVVVVHGVDYDNNGQYSGETKSDLDPALPTEATDPAICGVMASSQMSSMPAGGVDTGGGSTGSVENLDLIGSGGLAVIGGFAALAARRKLAVNA